MIRQETDEYVAQAEKFLYESGATLSYVKIGAVHGFPFDSKDNLPHYKYHVILQRGEKTYDFPFYDSAFNYNKNIMPTAYDILACLEKYEPPEDVWSFAVEFGYEINDKRSFDRVSRIYNAVKDQYEHLMDLFGEKWMEELRKIQ